LSALISLAVGFVVSIPFMNQTLHVGRRHGPRRRGRLPVGFVVAGILYWFLEPRLKTALPIEG
jgi:hypothetical protein